VDDVEINAQSTPLKRCLFEHFDFVLVLVFKVLVIHHTQNAQERIWDNHFVSKIVSISILIINY